MVEELDAMRHDITPIPAAAVFLVPPGISTDAARATAATLGLRVVVYGAHRWLVRPGGRIPQEIAAEPSDGARNGTAQRPPWWRRAVQALRDPMIP